MGEGFFLGFEKRAWDSDIEERDRYGIAANRSISGDGYVYDALNRAAKDKKLEVTVIGRDGEFSNRDADFRSKMRGLRSALGPRPKKLNPSRMDWHRDYTWTITANKKDKDFQSEDGDVESNIFHYIRKNVNI